MDSDDLYINEKGKIKFKKEKKRNKLKTIARVSQALGVIMILNGLLGSYNTYEEKIIGNVGGLILIGGAELVLWIFKPEDP